MSSSEVVNPAGLPTFPGLLAHGVVVPGAGLVFVAGQVAWDQTGAPVGDDLQSQFARAYENVDRVLEAAGSSRRRIVKETLYLVGYEHADVDSLMGLIAAARGDDPVPPASTLVGVEKLFAPGFLVEIEVVATR